MSPRPFLGGEIKRGIFYGARMIRNVGFGLPNFLTRPASHAHGFESGGHCCLAAATNQDLNHAASLSSQAPVPVPAPTLVPAPTGPGLTVQYGDLEDATTRYIVHLCDCETVGPGRGVAAAVFARYPHANSYTAGSCRVPGTISAHVPPPPQQQQQPQRRRQPDQGGPAGPTIVNLYGQRAPGPPSPKESEAERVEFFRAGLDAVKTLPGFYPATQLTCNTNKCEYPPHSKCKPLYFQLN